jgi:hypothetical protein
MNRRSLLHAAGLTRGSAALVGADPERPGQFTGRIHKSLKWGTAQKSAADMPLGEGSINWPAVRAGWRRFTSPAGPPAEVTADGRPCLVNVAKRINRVLDP